MSTTEPVRRGNQRTRTRKDLLQAASRLMKQGSKPSLEEIAAAFDLSSVATVHKHVKHLVDKGYLRKAWNRSRSVEPVPSAGAQDSVELPILGAVAACACCARRAPSTRPTPAATRASSSSASVSLCQRFMARRAARGRPVCV